MCHIFFDFLGKKLWYINNSFTFFGFGRINQILSFYAIIGFADIYLVVLKIYIIQSKSQKFPFTHSCVIQYFEHGIIFYIV